MDSPFSRGDPLWWASATLLEYNLSYQLLRKSAGGVRENCLVPATGICSGTCHSHVNSRSFRSAAAPRNNRGYQASGSVTVRPVVKIDSQPIIGEAGEASTAFRLRR
jgi:hypothetical protein